MGAIIEKAYKVLSELLGGLNWFSTIKSNRGCFCQNRPKKGNRGKKKEVVSMMGGGKTKTRLQKKKERWWRWLTRQKVGAHKHGVFKFWLRENEIIHDGESLKIIKSKKGLILDIIVVWWLVTMLYIRWFLGGCGGGRSKMVERYLWWKWKKQLGGLGAFFFFW